MDDESLRRIEAACNRLIARFAMRIDAGDASGVAELFARNGIWYHQGQTLAGRQAIHAAVTQRSKDPPDSITRHHFGNSDIRVLDEAHAEGRIYYTVYRHEGGGDIALPRPLQKIRIGEYQASFVLTVEGWRISSTRAVRLLEQ